MKVMKKFVYTFTAQLILVDIALNIRSDIPFEQQLFACILISLVYPLAELFGETSKKDD